MNEKPMTANECDETNASQASQEGRTYPPMRRCEYCGVDGPREALYWVVARHLEKPHKRHELWCLECSRKGQGGNTEQYEARFPEGYEETMTKGEIAYCEGYERALTEVIETGSATPCKLVKRYRETNRQWTAQNIGAILRGEQPTLYPLSRWDE